MHVKDRLWARKRERTELESYDEYFRVVAQLNANTRVIACRDGIQWILQRAGGGLWKGVSFCRKKMALLRCVRELCPGRHPALEALPDWFPEADYPAVRSCATRRNHGREQTDVAPAAAVDQQRAGGEQAAMEERS